ncbi:protein of unknown function [Prevotella sp. tc2-28]|uniref:DUF4861 domain-containing protein n=1 Tax=Prevotella sp. tc2-28 TaxID=1761888 RepID=UPI00089B28A1|nr:DUF4861 domain-containing protein [Prevotella sp. tc2-28]SEA03295.1 protein of unknown function [Prevotella sp. tc2-28]
MKRILSVIALAALHATVFANRTLMVGVSNPSHFARTDVPVVIPLTNYGDVRSALVTVNGQEIPCQLDDLNQDEIFDELCFLADLGKKEKKTYTITLKNEGEPRPYPARVYAEMVLSNTKDKNLKKHQQNNYIESLTARGDAAYTYNIQHHHGVDFESELNGIRIYFDARQTPDLYGKFKKQLELKETQFYTPDELKDQGYGDDVLWVGQTFGLGAFRGWDGQQPTLVEPVRSRTQRVISYGPLRAIVEVVDRGWKADAQREPVNMTLRYTQYAGHRDTDVDVFFNKDVTDYRFSTGIINVKGSEEFSDKKGLRACWGTDYPAADTIKWKRETVGLAVYVPQKNIVSEEPANKDNYAYVLKVNGKHMDYKVTYTSDNESFGYHSAKEWFKFLKEWKKEVEQPVSITVL